METFLPPMSPITPGRRPGTGPVPGHGEEEGIDALIRRTLGSSASEVGDHVVDHYEQDNVQLSEEEASKLREQVFNTFEEVKSKHELVHQLSERLRHIYSSSFLTDSVVSLGSSVAAPTPDLSAIPYNAPILSPLSIDTQYMERAEKEIARLETENAKKCREMEDIVFQMESMRSLHETEREKFRNERVALKSEIVELSVAVRGLRQNNRVVELEQEVKKLKAKNYELISMVNMNIENGKSRAKVSVGIEADLESIGHTEKIKSLEKQLEELVFERRKLLEKKFCNSSTNTIQSSLSTLTRDVGVLAAEMEGKKEKSSSNLSIVSSMYSLNVPSVTITRVSGGVQTDVPEVDLRVGRMESELESRSSRIGELLAERKSLFRTIEDLEDEVSALRENVGIVSTPTTDQSVECDIWDTNMREKYDKYKRQLLDATRRLRGYRDRVDPPMESVSVMTDLGGEVFDNAVEELQEQCDMYRLRLQELLVTKKRECWSQTPEKKKRDQEDQGVGQSVKQSADISTQTVAVATVSRGVEVDETSPILLELQNSVKRYEVEMGTLQQVLERTIKQGENREREIESLREIKSGLEEELCRVKENDFSEIIKPLQEKLVVVAPPSMSTCSPQSGNLFDYSQSTINNQLQQTLSSFSPLRLEMSTPRDKDGDIMMMTVARSKKDVENIAPLNGPEVVKEQAIVDIGAVLKGVQTRARAVSILSDRITYLSSLA